MSSLVTLANQKLDLALQERVRAMPTQIEAVKAEHAAKGLAKSGATLKRARRICISLFTEHADAITVEYRWAVNHALLATQSWTEELAASVPTHFKPLMAASARNLTEVATFTGHPELGPSLVREVEAELLIAKDRAQMAIRCAFAEKSRGLTRSLPAAIVNALSKVFRGGA